MHIEVGARVVVGNIVRPGAGGHVGAVKKKAPGVKNRRTGTQLRRVCKRTFPSWNGVNEHMHMHADHTGIPSSSWSKHAGGASQGM